MSVEKNEKGQVMVNLSHLVIKDEVGGGFDFYKRGIKEQGSICWHYNGGWIKRVTGVDKEKDTGYSILGDFSNNYERLAWQTPGLYLDCCIEGSRKNNFKYYTMFELTPEGEVNVLKTAKDGGDWAINFWGTIYDFFREPLNESTPEEDAMGKEQFNLIGASASVLQQYRTVLEKRQNDAILNETSSARALELLAELEATFHELNLVMVDFS